MGWGWKGRQGSHGPRYVGKTQIKLKGQMPNNYKQVCKMIRQLFKTMTDYCTVNGLESLRL